MRRRDYALAVVACAALTAGAAAGGTVGDRATTVTVRVTAKDFAFGLSRTTVPRGTTARFVVRNTGQQPHDFAIAGRRTRVLKPGASGQVTVRFPKAGVFRFLCDVPGHAQLGMVGRFGVSRPAPKTPAPPPPPPVVVTDTAKLTQIGAFAGPVHVASPPDVNDLFVVEQRGTVQRVVAGAVAPTAFLDIRERVKADSSEPGLLSIAFSPRYATDRTAYVFYNARKANGDIRISAFTHPTSDPTHLDAATERILLEIPKPWENHNGGQLQFGPDGYLYASIGDGDSGVLNPPGAFAQTRDDLLGNILRIDPTATGYTVPPDNPFVDVPGVRPEIWAYGLRNPWRFWIDPPTRRTLIGDVGLGTREELDLVARGQSGLNFGWPCFEGTVPFDTRATCVSPVTPVWESDRSDGGCALIAGVLVRDARLTALSGRFLIGDFCTGKVEAVAIPDRTVTSVDDTGLRVPKLSSFGVDAAGRIYVVSHDGPVYRLDPNG